MATAENAKLEMELGQTAFAYTATTDSGDHIVHTVSSKTIFSNKSGYDLNVRPDGIVTGRNILSTHATDDTVTIAAFTCYIAGVLTSVAATTDTITRPAEGKANICSVIATATDTVDVLVGTDSATTALVETRGAAGGPPYITVGAVEIGQIRVTSHTAAAIDSDEIFQTVGTHTERFDYPTWSVNPVGDGNDASVTAKKNAYIEFASEIGSAIHTGDTYKLCYVSGYTPNFAEISNSVDFVPAEDSHSVSSTQVYNGTIGSTSSSLGQAKFTAMLTDGVTDSLISERNEILTFRFYPNRNKTPYSLTQGKLGIKSTFPAADQIQAAATISSETKTALFSS